MTTTVDRLVARARNAAEIAARAPAPRPAGGQAAGLGAGLGAGTAVLTLQGELPVDHLCEGDRIVTRRGARILRSITGFTAGDSCIVAPHTLGTGRPGAPVTLAAEQPILLRDWRARALYGCDRAMVPISRLADGTHVTRSDAPVRLWLLEFDAEEVIQAAGMDLVMPARTG